MKKRREGPTVLFTTGIHRIPGEQLDSRFDALDVPDDRVQQLAALARLSELEHAGREMRPPADAFAAFKPISRRSHRLTPTSCSSRPCMA